ncbi:tRNA (adenosine(37)-N6)-threonylcarbamoyltransferase complex ATPase subunit type 1 TsaE [Corynebacterium sp. zg-331]|uniref:tRNA (adenosine(37)-N6)-threonylcarbamoyltransferase complex ATPase subunit type 1 TsaE n=1 Tax=unclassified Corynebacterium TaxID=2624378 RepID=UPI00128DB04A|nr:MULTISPECIES: tRNA (adenosine(37)-N6)-threonylcarbamoyltransferase complex ATPase subunit type 1 TsaE [unclassified Corynebacterium]MBC3185993.1 tRNA (adenosine(37)-N6)-threonylcarbamoyltransferase complex ATPase subunit type 1 TsaE [Corynebacterium sp. zg-331]MPV52484.1 tRNA (adenosine(37)-N6)-threonylcarbamoyltransferase complex ATPase subunit type 1 TsaE [Corynebacterium sp. zg331]
MKETLPAEGMRRCEDAEDTRALGAYLGAALEAGDVVLLDGPLGAGKTTLTQGIATGMGVRGRVTSPTFIIAREHRHRAGGPTLIHVDAYRLLGEGEAAADPTGALDSLDLDSELTQAVVVAEWGGGLVEQIAGEYLFVCLDRITAVEHDPSSEARIISWQRRGGA